MLAALWLCYMCASALWSITEVKVWGNRALVRRSTYLESACWYAAQVAKLTVPLAYNFLEFTPPAVQTATRFYHFLGELIVLTPLGKGFTSFFPAFVLIPVLASLFNLYGRVKSISGFGDLMDEDDEVGGWREGRALLERESRGGHVGGGVGLTGQADSSPDGSRDVSPMPSTERSATAAATIPTSSRPPRSTRADRHPLLQQDDIPEEGETSAIEEFAHRVKNTLDTRLSGLADGFKMPKWMAGQDGNRGLARWFGRPSEGRVRL